jgi:hypothetical protein
VREESVAPMNLLIGPVVRAAFDQLIDYAGLFPPAKLPLAPAVAEYAAARDGASAWMLGRFIAPASRIAELAGVWEARREPAPLPLSVIADVSLDGRLWFASLQNAFAGAARVGKVAPQVLIEALEIPLPPPLSARETFDAPIGQLRASLDHAGMRDLPAYVELPRGARWRELLTGAMAALARTRLSAKIRCGGMVADAFPPVDEVAAFVSAAVNEGIAFKATAGLHHPVRHRDPGTGFFMHGFLNLLAAATFAPRASADQLERIVAEEDPDAFALGDSSLRWRDQRADLDDVRATRASAFVGYGSCSFSEPVEDLTALGLLPASAV